MSYRGAHTGVPVDWNDPEQASLQAKIDTMRELISHNPMTYSEKEGIVRHHISSESRREEAGKNKPEKKPGTSWDI